MGCKYTIGIIVMKIGCLLKKMKQYLIHHDILYIIQYDEQANYQKFDRENY